MQNIKFKYGLHWKQTGWAYVIRAVTEVIAVGILLLFICGWIDDYYARGEKVTQLEGVIQKASCVGVLKDKYGTEVEFNGRMVQS